jgi:hypothetical protein
VKQGSNWAIHGVVSRMTERSDAQLADDEEMMKAQARRDAAGHERKEAQEAVAAAGTDPKTADVKAKLGTLDAQYTEKSAKLDQIRQSKQAGAGELEQLSTWFLEAAGDYESLRKELENLKGAPTELQVEADKIFRDAENAVRLAGAALAAPAILTGLVIPSVGPAGPDPTPAESVTAARDALQAVMAAAPRTVTTAEQLVAVRGLAPLISRTAKAVGDARNDIRAVNQVRTQADAVEKVYRETTNYGTVGDRTAEGAARHEVQTGARVAGKWHGFKCRDFAVNLTRIIGNLERQKAALPKSVHKAIDAAIARAEDRRARLQAAWEVWNERYERDPTFGR